MGSPIEPCWPTNDDHITTYMISNLKSQNRIQFLPNENGRLLETRLEIQGHGGNGNNKSMPDSESQIHQRIKESLTDDGARGLNTASEDHGSVAVGQRNGSESKNNAVQVPQLNGGAQLDCVKATVDSAEIHEMFSVQDTPRKTLVLEKDIEGSREGQFIGVDRAAKRIKTTILFATESGRSEQYAKKLGQIFSHAFKVKVMCMEDYDVLNLVHETLLLVVTSSFANGDPPQNGEAFAKSLQAIKGKCERKSDYKCIRFGVFALGSSAYPNFCNFGRYLDSMLGDMGGERIIKMGEGDQLYGQEQSFNRWAEEVFQVACNVFCVAGDIILSAMKANILSDTSWNPENIRLVDAHDSTDLCTGVSKGTNRKVVSCTLRHRTVIQSKADSRQTLLIQIAMNPDRPFEYFPGDQLGVYPANQKDLVDGILGRMSTTCPDPDKLFELQLRKTVETVEGPSHHWYPHERIPAVTMRTALTRHLDITTPPGQEFLKILETMAEDEEDKRKIELLATDSIRYENWKSQQFPNLLDVLSYFPSVEPTPEFLLTQLSPLQPRFYSISSAPDFHPGHIHITVAVVEYKTENEVDHFGVCTNYLAWLPIGSEMACFVRFSPSFRMPESSRAPLILVGPGTAIAPFRSFWQQRHLDMKASIGSETKSGFGKITLLSGCRYPNVEFYREEAQKLLQKGVLTHVYSAYSRVPGKEKRYVQHILYENSEEVYKDIMQENGHFYVCGDVIMAEDVNRTLRTIIQEQGHMDLEAANNVFKRLQEENRYHADIFGLTWKTAEVTRRATAAAKLRLGIST